MTDDLDLGWLLAVAGAAVWSPRPLASWFSALGDARAVSEHARVHGPFPPTGAESLSADILARLAALDDNAAGDALGAAIACNARVLTKDHALYPPRILELCDAPHVLYV